MPAPNQIDPTSRRSRIRLFFATNPGRHRPRDVATALGDEYLRVANELARMARDGDLMKVQTPIEGKVRPLTTYGLNESTEENTNA